MCGILVASGREAVPEGFMKGFVRLGHRGPDASHILCGRRSTGEAERRPFEAGMGLPPGTDIAMGHHRLSIIDLDPRSDQPFSSRDGRYHIAYNGEVYNYKALRGELEGKGFIFETDGDTEVVLASYIHWGEGCVERFLGMWAFVVWDAVDGTLFASRDPFGIKPLYYASVPGGIIIASEIKGLLPLLSTTAPRREAVLDFLLFNLQDHEETTFFEGVFQVPPAHRMRFGTDGLVISKERYWSPPAGTEEMTPGEAADRFREAFLESIDLHLVSDVEIGFCLSGGLDSSAIVCAVESMGRTGARRCFTAAFDVPEADEREYAEAVIEKTGFPYHPVSPDERELMERIDSLVYIMDEPFVSGSIFAQWAVMRRVGETGLKVVLDGQGADELMGGYPTYEGVLRAGSPLSAGSPREILRSLYFGLGPGMKFALASRMKEEFRAVRPGIIEEYGPRARRIYDDLVYTDLEKRLKADTTRMNLPKLLHYEDRNSMSFSIESRVPFLVTPLADLVLSMPSSALIDLSTGERKLPIRRGLRDILPEKVLGRKTKMGFEVPERSWLDPLRKKGAEAVLAGGSFVGGLIPRRRIEEIMLGEWRDSRKDLYFKLVDIETWHDRFFGAAS